MSLSLPTPQLGMRALGVIVLLFGVLAMHGLTNVAAPHNVVTNGHSASMVLENTAQVTPSQEDDGMRGDMFVLMSCISVLVASAGALGLRNVRTRTRTSAAPLANPEVRRGLSALVGRSPPIDPSPTRLPVLLT